MKGLNFLSSAREEGSFPERNEVTAVSLEEVVPEEDSTWMDLSFSLDLEVQEGNDVIAKQKEEIDRLGSVIKEMHGEAINNNDELAMLRAEKSELELKIRALEVKVDCLNSTTRKWPNVEKIRDDYDAAYARIKGENLELRAQAGRLEDFNSNMIKTIAKLQAKIKDLEEGE